MKRATIDDVAKAAGVSRQTVSRAINNKSEINPATKARVMEAVKLLGYVPNRLAQGMVTRSTRTVGLIIGDVTNPFFAEVARGVQDLALQHDYHVILSNTDNDVEIEERYLNSLRAQGVDGILGFLNIADDRLAAFADMMQTTVLINRHFDHPNVDTIVADIQKGARLAVEHLIAQNHRKIGMLTSASTQTTQLRREQGYQDALVAAGIPQQSAYFASGLPTINGGYQAALRLLTTSPEITAIFAYNDLMALGAVRAARELDRSIPTELAIIGFDDIAIAALTNPALTTVRVHQYEIGRRAMQAFLNMQMDTQSETIYKVIRDIDVQLVIRESA